MDAGHSETDAVNNCNTIYYLNGMELFFKLKKTKNILGTFWLLLGPLKLFYENQNEDIP